jgi:DNA-binding Xre family transcriptional regulator
MLHIQIEMLLRARGFKPTGQLLKRWGITHTVAYKLIQGKLTTISLAHLYILCECLHCTPNDILVYKPFKNPLLPKHPLHTLNQQHALIQNPFNTLMQISPQQLKELTQHINTTYKQE